MRTRPKSTIKYFITALLMALAGKPAAGRQADTAYVHKYRESLNLTTCWRTRNLEFRVNYPGNYKLILGPKEVYQFAIKAQYSFLTVNYAFTPAIINPRNASNYKGTSQQSSGNIDFSIGRLSTELFFNYTQGFYLHNTSDFIKGWKKGVDPYITFPALTNVQAGLQISYNTNRNFSTSGVFGGREQQLKTAFSLLPCLTVGINVLEEASGDTAGNFISDGDINLILPVAMNYVLSPKLTAALYTGPIIGVDFYQAGETVTGFDSIQYKETLLSWGYYIKCGIGYNNERWFCGGEAMVRNYGNREFAMNGRNALSKLYYGVQVYAGIRLQPPGVLARSTRWIQRHSPFEL